MIIIDREELKPFVSLEDLQPSLDSLARKIKYVPCGCCGGTIAIPLIVSHYDTVAKSPGANDNGSGIAAMLEVARGWSKPR